MEFVTASAPGAAASFLILGVLLVLCGRLGGALLGVTGVRGNVLDPVERHVFSIGLGLLVFALGILAAGSAGFLTRQSVIVLLALIGVLPFFYRREKGCFAVSDGKAAAAFIRENPLFILAVSAVMVFTALEALAPPLGNDALAYHLAHPREFILQGKIAHLPQTRESLWPYLTEMLFTAGLLLQGTALAQLFHWVFFGLTAAATYAFAARFYSKPAAAAAALIFLYTPLVFGQAGQAYVDLSLAFFILAAFYCFALSPVLGVARSALLAGVFCGGAMGTKYLGIGCFAALLVLWAARPFRMKTTGLFALAAFLVSGVWYLRSAWVLGNPFYPFFHPWFGRGYDFGIDDQVGMGESPLAFLALIWNLTMHPGRFGGPLLGPSYLQFLPLLLLGFKRAEPKRISVDAAAFTAVYVLFVFVQAQQMRFFIPALPFLAVGAAMGFQWCRERGGRLKTIAVFVFVFTLVTHGLIAARRVSAVWSVVSGKETASDALGRRERSFKGYAYFKEHVRPGERVFNNCERRRFYNPVPGMVFDDYALREDLEYRGMKGPITDYLDRERFDYLWIERRSDGDIQNYVKGHGYERVFFYQTDPAAGDFFYEIYKLRR